MAPNIPQGQEHETKSWIGVGEGPNSLPEGFTGETINSRGEMKWGGSGGKRVERKAKKEEVEKEEEIEEESSAEASPEHPLSGEIGAEWVCDFMQKGLYLFGGLKIAPGLVYPKGWLLPAKDQDQFSTLYLISARAYEEGMELYWTYLSEEMTKVRQGGVFPSSQKNLLDDVFIGPIIAMVAPSEELEEKEGDKNGLTDV